MERRLAYRFLADKAVNCRVPATPAIAQLVDISTGGCRIQVQSSLVVPGGTILLELVEGFHAVGKVLWRNGKEAGISFSQTLHQSIIDHVRTADC